jgi:hypothetical protein
VNIGHYLALKLKPTKVEYNLEEQITPSKVPLLIVRHLNRNKKQATT